MKYIKIFFLVVLIFILIACGGGHSGSSDGIVLYTKKCAMCHGINAEKKAIGKSDVIVSWDAAKIEEALNGYKVGSRNVHGMGHMHSSHLSTFSAEDIKAVSDYIDSLN